MVDSISPGGPAADRSGKHGRGAERFGAAADSGLAGSGGAPTGGPASDADGLGIDTETFGALFQQFLSNYVHTVALPESELTRTLTSFFGSPVATLPVVTGTYLPFELPSLHLAVAAVVRANELVDLIGVGGLGREYRTLTEMASEPGIYRPAAVDYRAVTVAPGEELSCVSFGLHLLLVGERRLPTAILLRADDPNNSRGEVKIEVMSADSDANAALLAELERRADELSVLRGQVLSIQPHAFTDGVGPVRFHERPVVTAADIVMPPGVLEGIERQVLGVAGHREELRRRGQHLRRGVLLHGPPGTGKTLTIRYLMAQLPEATVVVVTGAAMKHLATACDIARKFQPALVVIEDVDLVAEDRALLDSPQPLLMDMLNALDGLGEDNDVVFVLTTNRAETLERALVDRPGRVDLAVEIPLPDEDGLVHLFRLYGGGTRISHEGEREAARRCVGVTASFVKEAVRRAVLISVEEGAAATGDEHLASALDELLDARSALTKMLLGGGSSAPAMPSPAATGRGPRRPADFGGNC